MGNHWLVENLIDGRDKIFVIIFSLLVIFCCIFSCMKKDLESVVDRA